MTQKSPDSSVYHVTILDRNHHPLQEGSLETTPTSLIYTEDTSLTKYSWPIKHLRKFEAKGENLFVIEAGKLCLSGIGEYTFSSPHAKHIFAVVSRNASTLSSSQQQQQRGSISSTENRNSFPSDSSPVHWRLNTSSVSSASDSSINHSPAHSRSSSLIREGVYEVERIMSDIRATEYGTLEVGNGVVVYTDSTQRQSLQWPKEYLRRHGHESDVLIIETGRRCLGGAGLYNFRTPHAAEINAAIRALSSSGVTGSTSSGGDEGTSPSPTEVRVQMSSGKFSTPPPSSGGIGPQGVANIGGMSPPPAVPRRTGPLPPLPVPATPTQHQATPPPPSLPPPPIPLAPVPGGSGGSGGGKRPTPPPPTKPPRASKTSPTHNHTPYPSITPLQPSTGHGSPPLAAKFPHKKSDSLRRAFSAMDLRKDVYEVRNLSDDRKEVGQGTLEVTATDLIYIDSRTSEKWRWPFKFLRKYGFEKEIFSFEAGRRCAGGPGLYAFATEHAQEIHEAIVENIRGGNAVKKLNPTKRTMNNYRSNPRLSSSSNEKEKATPPRNVPAAKGNQYSDMSPSASRKSYTPPHQAPPTATPPIYAQRTATPPEIMRPRSHRAASSPHVPEFNSDYSLSSAHPRERNENARMSIPVSFGGSDDHTPSPPPPPLPQCRLVKPVMDQPSAKHREHLYEVPQNQGNDSGHKPERNGISPTPDLSSELLKGELSGSGRSTPQMDYYSNSIERKASVSPDDVTIAQQQQRPSSALSDEGGKKEKKSTKHSKKGNVLDWLMKRHSHHTDEQTGASSGKSKSKRKKGKKSAKDKSVGAETEHTDGGAVRENAGGEEEQVNYMYQNLEVAKLSKKAYSASCSDILDSLNKSDYAPQSADSSVPQPSLHAVSPPLDIARPRSAEFTESDQPSSVYQNLENVRPSSGARASSGFGQARTATPPAQTTPTHHSETTPTGYQTTPTSASTEDSFANSSLSSTPALYSNIELADSPFGTPTLISEPEKQTSYALIEVLPAPQRKTSPAKKPPKKQSSVAANIMELHNHRLRSESNGAGTNSNSNATPNSNTSYSDADLERSLHEPVQYASINVQATKALAQIRQEHKDVRNFEGLLERHDVREMEARKKKGRVARDRDSLPPPSP